MASESMPPAEPAPLPQPHLAPSQYTEAATMAVSPRPYGFWGSLGWLMAIAISWVVAQTLVTIAFIVAYVAQHDGNRSTIELESLQSNGLLLATVTLGCLPVVVGLCALATRLRGWKVADYLALRPFTAGDLLLGIAVVVGYIAVVDGLTLLLDRPIVPEFMEEAYLSAGWLPLLVLALVVAAPIGEELLFRGFLLRGLATSWLGPVGAVVLTSIAWAVIHLQYDLLGIGQIFVAGLLLGWLRLRSGSTLLCIVLHALQNIVATIEVVVKMELM